MLVVALVAVQVHPVVEQVVQLQSLLVGVLALVLVLVVEERHRKQAPAGTQSAVVLLSAFSYITSYTFCFQW